MNYQEELEKIIEQNKGKTLLLHSCCAPCSSYVLEYLSDYFKITILYYNPNISPYSEYLKRKEEQIRLINTIKTKYKVDILDIDYENDIWEEQIKGLENEPERGIRCDKCYRLRLSKTALKAKELGYDFFGTTLTVSPYKNSNTLNEIGKELMNEYKVNYLFSDFKKKDGYKRSIELSKKYNLYRQDYCGCVYSKYQSELKRSTVNEESI